MHWLHHFLTFWKFQTASLLKILKNKRLVTEVSLSFTSCCEYEFPAGNFKLIIATSSRFFILLTEIGDTQASHKYQFYDIKNKVQDSTFKTNCTSVSCLHRKCKLIHTFKIKITNFFCFVSSIHPYIHLSPEQIFFKLCAWSKEMKSRVPTLQNLILALLGMHSSAHIIVPQMFMAWIDDIKWKCIYLLSSHYILIISSWVKIWSFEIDTPVTGE